MKKSITLLLLFSGVFIGAAIVLPFKLNKIQRVPMFENEQVKVWKTIIAPNTPLAMHRHEHGRTIVVIKGGQLTIRQDTGEEKTVDWKSGQAYWLDADPPGNKMHADVNLTKDTIEVMVVECKRDK